MRHRFSRLLGRPHAAPALLASLAAVAPVGCATSNEAHNHGKPQHGQHGQPPGHHGHGHHDHRSGAPHRFENADEWAKHFEGPERDAWQKPDAVVAAVGLGPSQTIADIGAGTGYFAVRFARKAPGAKVFGIDIEPDMIRYMTERASREKLPNLTPVLGTASDPAIPSAVDVVFLCDTYHHIDQREAYFKKVAASLAPGGKLVIVDFKPIETPVGPPLSMRLAPQQIDAELAPAGFKRASLDETTLPYQYIVTYTRAPH